MIISDKSKIILNKLISEKVIPETGQFEITEKMIDIAYNKYYVVKRSLKPSDVRYGRKIAGLNLMKLNIQRAEISEVSKLKSPKSNIKCGIVYIITNEAFPGYFKIGMTTDLESRLKSYQVYDPLQRYKVEHYNFVIDRRATEKMLLDRYNLDISAGEWITNKKVKMDIMEL